MRRISWRNILLTGMTSLGLANSGCAQGPTFLSQEWYAERSNDPPGARQVDSHGKLWPPVPRPVGRKQTYLHAYHYAHYWPYPHNCEDQAYTQNIMNQQAGNGWVIATTLHDYHFDPDTQQLTEGARNHLIWVANSVPGQFRTVYVSQGESREVAQLRLEKADEFYREMAIPNPPPILSKADVFLGRPAAEVDRIRQLELQTIPRQRLFYIGSATAGGIMGGGGGGMMPMGGQGGGQNGQGTTTIR